MNYINRFSPTREISDVCHLCRNKSNLCKSHIIPELFFKLLRDDRRQIIVRANSGMKFRPKDKGLWECLLCDRCEKLLNKHETYVGNFIHALIAAGTLLRNGQIEIERIEFSSVRLCFLSILWRMSISSMPFFKSVELHEHHEERLRCMILDGNPGEPEEYGFSVIVPLINGKFSPEMILEPDCILQDKLLICRTVIGGLIIYFFVSDERLSKELEASFVQKDGKWKWSAEDVRRIAFLYEWIKEMDSHERD